MTTIVGVRALSSTVLAVAVANTRAGDWSAYIDSVKGNYHEKEAEQVADEGAKLTHDLARVLFPSIEERYRWRD